MAILKWNELTKEQRDKVIDYNVSAECLRDDVYDMESDFREMLKQGQDAVWQRVTDLIDWWDNMDEEYQQEILE